MILTKLLIYTTNDLYPPIDPDLNMAQTLIKNIIRQLLEIQEGSLWFDQCFKDKIDRLTESRAFACPVPGVHSVAEHVSHILEWRKECMLRYTGTSTDLMNSPDDWKTNAVLQETGWALLKEQLYNSTAALISLLDNRDDSYLDTPFGDTDYNFHYLIEGIIQHDLYHLGQIGVTLKLLDCSNQ